MQLLAGSGGVCPHKTSINMALCSPDDLRELYSYIWQGDPTAHRFGTNEWSHHHAYLARLAV